MSKRITMFAAVALVSIGVVVWYVWPRRLAVDPVVEQARATQTKLMANFETAPVKDQVKAMTELRSQMEEMTPEQRRKVMEGPNGPRAFMRRDAEAFVKLPPEERQAFLDKRIDKMQEMFAAMRAMRRPGEGGGPGGGGAGGGGPSGGGGPGGGGPGGGDGGGRGPWDGGSGSRTEREKNMLNKTSADERALFTEYFRALMGRMKERGGMPGMPGGGPF